MRAPSYGKKEHMAYRSVVNGDGLPQEAGSLMLRVVQVEEASTWSEPA